MNRKSSRPIKPKSPPSPQALVPLTMEQRLRRLEEIHKQATSSPEAAKAYLMSTGMYTPTGRLKKKFQTGEPA